MNCLQQAWLQHSAEIGHWALRRLPETADAEDLLQDVFLKALRQGDRFCSIGNARAWLFEVARNTLADRLRVRRETVELPPDLADGAELPRQVDALTQCLPRVLTELPEADREALTLCDLQGMPQAEFARRKGLSLSAAKSRVQRARERLRVQLTRACQVRVASSGDVEDFVPRGPAPY